MAQMTVVFDDRTEKAISELKLHFGASSKVEVLRKAINLLKAFKIAQEAGRELAVVDPSQKTITSIVLM